MKKSLEDILADAEALSTRKAKDKKPLVKDVIRNFVKLIDKEIARKNR